MNCETYREAITAEPSFDDDSHLSECRACRAYRDELLALDRLIGKALAIDAPPLRMPDLPEISEENVVTLGDKRTLRKAPIWFALAATTVLAAFVGVRMIGQEATYDSLAAEIVAHLDHEPYALVVTDKAVSEVRLENVVPADVAVFDRGAGLISYAQSCVINGHTVPHLVIQGETGPVTILLMPDERISAAVDLSGESISGVLLPVGSGSIAIIGNRGEQLEPIRNKVVNSVMWET